MSTELAPRPYQLDCLGAVQGAFGQHRGVLVELPTGTGKTVAFAHLTNRWDGRVLIMAHREELIDQAASKVKVITGEAPGVYKGKDDLGLNIERWPRTIVTTVQTMCRPGRHQRFPREYFGLVVIDEAHHSVAPSYLTVTDYFREAKILGVSATPKRLDKRALGQVFDTVAYRYAMADAIHDGWLVPVHQQCVQIDDLDFSQVRDVAHEFHKLDLENLLTQETPLHKMARPIVEEAGTRPTLVFCCSVKHAQALSEVIERYKPGATAWLCGDHKLSPPDERRRTVQRFRNGELQFLLSCSLFLEGFDVPEVSMVVMGRPTKSLGVYTQTLGRGTRPLTGIVDGLETSEERRLAIAQSAKPRMIVLDFAGNAGRHKIVSAVDVLGGKFGTDTRHYARQLSEEDKEAKPVEELLNQAEKELGFILEERERRKKIKADVSYRMNTVNPFDPRQATASQGGQYRPAEEPATEAQIWKLGTFGVSRERASRCTKKQASGWIGRLKREREVS